MNEVIIVKPDKCIGCNACVRTCPAPEANASKNIGGNKFITMVNSQKCIACGECVRSCRHGARDFLDDTEEFMSRLSEEKMIIIAAPAIKIALPRQWKSVLDWFKKKGCIIFDGSYGADICTWAHLKAIEYQKMGSIITQPCAAVVNYIEMYQPKLLKNLSNIQSPLGCEAVFIKKYLRRNNPIAALTPCIAKKTEFAETELIQYNVTFKKLMEYFDKNDIIIPNMDYSDYEYEFEEQQGQFGSAYPRPGGLRDNLWQKKPDISIINSEGVGKIFPELEIYASLPENKLPDVFDVLSCEYGCNIGVGADTRQSSFEIMKSMQQIETEAKNKTKSKGMFRANDDKLYKYFDESLDMSDFVRTYRSYMPSPMPAAAELEPIYKLMGKNTDSERHYDCHACGYNSCYEMAVSIFRGLNTPMNCAIQAKDIIAERHSELTAQHERLEEITANCLELSDKIIHDIREITESMEAIGVSNEKTGERAGAVNVLLKSVVSFCNSNPTMNANAVGQLITILQKAIKAFGLLDENVSITSESSASIGNSIKKIDGLIEELNSTLHKTLEIQ